jgi:hypothetical protein
MVGSEMERKFRIAPFMLLNHLTARATRQADQKAA